MTSAARAHPRSRGENYRYALNPGSSSGSSPLTRGKLITHEVNIANLGLIPAHAGKTSKPSCRRAWLKAHPRSRGENFPGARSPLHGAGSSPLTRGKLFICSVSMRRTGLIPAHAGKTLSLTWQAYRPAGSSPLTRGKPEWREMSTSDAGLIPAHAGKTKSSAQDSVEQGAHPRSRGENEDSQRSPVRGEGSSPLTRGKHPGPD